MEKKPHRPRLGRASSVIAAAIATTVVPLSARAQTWIGGAGTNNWNVAANWSPATVPGSSAVVRIVNADGAARTVNYNYTGAPITLSSIVVDQTGAGSNALSVGANRLAVVTETIGQDGRGYLAQSGGTNAVTADLRLGYNAGGSGGYGLGGGTLTAANLLLGKNGNASFSQSGGSATIVTDLRPYAAYGRTASYTLYGAGSLTTKNLIVSGDGASSYTQNGGTANVTGLFSLFSAVGDATATLGGGTLTTDQQTIGAASARYATFNHTAGTNVARILSVNGTYSLAGSGALSVSGYAAVGTDDDGVFNQFGGSATIPTLHVGNGQAGTYDHSGGVLNANVLQVATGSASVGTYKLSGTGVLKTSLSEVGMGGTGTFNQTGGTHTASFLGIGESASKSGNYTLGGTSVLQTGTTKLGEFGGSGSLTESGGSHTTTHLVLGDGANGFSWGSYYLQGGQLTVNGAAEVGLNGGMGDLYHSAGTATFQTLAVGTGPDGTSGGFTQGNYELSGSGSLTVTGSESVGANGGYGTFTQTGGTHVVKSASPGTTAAVLQIGAQSGSDGTFKLSGGSLTTDATNVGGAGNGSFQHSAGTQTVNGTLAVSPTAGGSGEYRLSGTGVLKPAAVTVGGGGGTSSFTQSGGTHLIAGQLALRADADAYTLSGGSLTAASLQSEAAFYQTGGTAQFGTTSGSGLLAVYAGQFTAAHVRQGQLLVDETGRVNVLPNGGPGGVSRVKKLTLYSSGTLDLANNALVIDYLDGASPLANVRGVIQNARNGGSWTGPGLTSSTAAANPGATGVGYAEAADVLGPSGGTFMGQSVDGTAVLVRYTRLGDANLDGVVNFSDLLALAKNYNAGASTLGDGRWSRGDFTYDGMVNFSDLLVLAKNYNTALPSDPVPGAPAGFDAELAQAFAAAVPEPMAMSMVLTVACGAGLTSRRRRRRRRAPLVRRAG